MSLEELESEILKLPEEDRERLARSIMRTLEPDPEVERLWIEEAERRYQDYIDGREEAIPGEEALRSLRAMLE